MGVFLQPQKQESIYLSSQRYMLDILKEEGYITADQFQEILDHSVISGKTEIEALLELGHGEEEEICKIIARHTNIPYVSVGSQDIPQEIISLIPVEIARRYKVIPIEKKKDSLVVATANPFDLNSIDSLSLLLQKKIEVVMSSTREINYILERRYNPLLKAEDTTLAQEARQIEQKFNIRTDTQERDDIEKEIDEDAPVIKLVSLLILEAFRARASDIHIEPLQDKLRVRYRIDGILHEIEGPPKRLQSSIISRIKIMAKISIAEKRLPQDGRIRLNLMHKEIDLRVSTLPSVYGESVVMRILDRSSLLLGMEELGFSDLNLQRVRHYITQPNGIMLLTGPTGSGKTTTLYACLSELNRPFRKIITVEDPIEYQITGINQVQVQDDISLSFSRILRSMLRQAPNVIMIGEIRDFETAEIAIQASLTGHLVFSTLHTNDAPSAVTRLIDQGVKPFLVASALRSVLAQRLVRRICDNCKEPFKTDMSKLKLFNIDKEKLANHSLYHGTGCGKCKGTGYRGRIAITELFEINTDIQKLIYKKVSAKQIRELARQNGMVTLREDGIDKVIKGITTVDEILRVTARDEN